MHKIDIFDLTKHIDDGDISFYSSLDNETKKSFHPIVVQRWLSSIDSNVSLLNINGILNDKIFHLHNHPDLLYKLMIACTNQKYNNYFWVKQFSKKQKYPNAIKLLQEAYNKTVYECEEIIHMFSLNDLLEICDTLGKDSDYIKQIKNEYKSK